MVSDSDVGAILIGENFDELCLEMVDDEDLTDDAVLASVLQLQEALVSSSISSAADAKRVNFSASLSFTAAEHGFLKVEGGDDAESSSSYCGICMENKAREEMFKNSDCPHTYCCECISKHVKTRLDDRKAIIRCPDLNCKVAFRLDACRPILSRESVDIWEETLSRDSVNDDLVVYCPSQECSAMFIIDLPTEEEGIDDKAECLICHKLFCIWCNVPWHYGMDCNEFRSLMKDEKKLDDDTAALDLARNMKWSRCPSCKFVVERTQGCLHIVCRCGFEFCYGCGSEWSNDHYNCTS